MVKMQATSKVFDEASEKVVTLTDTLLVQDVDPDQFKQFMYQEQEELDDKELIDAPVISPMQLVQPKPFLHTILKAEALDAVKSSAGVLDAIFEHISCLVTHIKTHGVETTSVVIHDENSLLDLTEIIVECFDTAPGVFNIEIKTCSKLQELLIKQQHTLCLRAESSCQSFKIQRLDVSTYNTKDYISGTKLKKVTMNEAGQNDTQT